MSTYAPRHRRAHLDTERILDELVVYDRTTHQSHCLNRSAACVWELADGTRSVALIAEALAERCAIPVDEDVVQYCLGQLRALGLLEPDVEPRPAQISRRALIGRLGTA